MSPGSRAAAGFGGLDVDDAWGKLTAPVLLTLDEARLPALPPTLRVVNHSDEAAP